MVNLETQLATENSALKYLAQIRHSLVIKTQSLLMSDPWRYGNVNFQVCELVERRERSHWTRPLPPDIQSHVSHTELTVSVPCSSHDYMYFYPAMCKPLNNLLNVPSLSEQGRVMYNIRHLFSNFQKLTHSYPEWTEGRWDIWHTLIFIKGLSVLKNEAGENGIWTLRLVES